MKKIQVILGSTRQGRAGDKVAKWVMNELSQNQDFEYEFLDLRDYPLPFFNETVGPSNGPLEYTDEIAKKWAAKIKEGSGYIIVTPEYNHSVPAVLKNALDYLYTEWNGKPMALVTYGAFAGGVRAAEHLKQIANELQMPTIRDEINIPTVWAAFDEQGSLIKADFYSQKLKSMIEKLKLIVR